MPRAEYSSGIIRWIRWIITKESDVIGQNAAQLSKGHKGGNGVAGQDSKQCRNNFQNNVSVRNFNDCRYFNAAPSYCSHNADIHIKKYGLNKVWEIIGLLKMAQNLN